MSEGRDPRVLACMTCKIYISLWLPEEKQTLFRVSHMHGGSPSGWTRVMEVPALPAGFRPALTLLEQLAVAGKER